MNEIQKGHFMQLEYVTCRPLIYDPLILTGAITIKQQTDTHTEIQETRVGHTLTPQQQHQHTQSPDLYLNVYTNR